MDAKILYQYPKGQFKFPLIPDHEQNRDNVRKGRKQGKSSGPHRDRNQGYESKQQQTRSKPQETTINREINKIKPSKKPFRPTEIPSPVYGFKKPHRASEEVEFELNKENPSKKPFQPTEIPSPVYGFNKPHWVSEEIVEFELDSKEQIATTDPDIPAIVKKESLAEQGYKASAGILETVESSDDTKKGNNPVSKQLEQKTPGEGITAEPGKDLAGEMGEGTAFLDQDSGLAAEADISPVLDSMDGHVFDKNTIESENPFVHEQMRPAKEAGAQENVSSEGVRALASGLYYGKPSEASQSQGNETTIQNIMEKSDIGFEKDCLIENGESGPINEAANAGYLPANQSGADESLQTPEETMVSSGIEQKPKKHIPFNVVMLKQDRERMGSYSPSHRPKAEPVIKQPEAAKPALALQDNKSDEGEPYYVMPKIELLTPPAQTEYDDEWLDQQADLLNETLLNFNVRARVVNVTQGPSVTRFEVQPEAGVKVNKVTNLQDDIKLSLAAEDIRMEAPIPGKHTIGIEIPNRKSKPVFLREVLQSEAFQTDKSPLTVALGLDISGQPVVTDLKKMPHGLIAGATGSGKSVCINTMLVSLLYKASPQELKLLLIDPKMVELAPYNRIPHLVSPVITDVKAATAALKWAVDEMERRYELFAHAGVREISRFNSMAENAGQLSHKLPYIVVIIDELADLMMMSPAEVEEAICRIAQKARACGIHLIVATQRPSVDVITGLIKANIPTRIAFSVSSQVDSRTIIDSGGAEKLLGKGDMLFAENGSSKTVRLQGTFVNDDEIDSVVSHVRSEQEPQYLFQQEELLSKAQSLEESDELFFEACEFVVSQNAASTSSLQRRFHVGYNRAARLIEMMEKQGIVSESRGSRPRDVLISVEELEFLSEANAIN
ncbi:DNA translocase FtsK [Peribacillus saganii]